MDRIYGNVVSKFKSHDNVSIHREFSIEVSFPDQYFDWVYIDGDHTYEVVLKDLEFYYPLVKKGGYLCGDDYGWGPKGSRKHPDGNGGPKRAVDEFVNTNNLEVIVKGLQFVIRRK